MRYLLFYIIVLDLELTPSYTIETNLCEGGYTVTIKEVSEQYGISQDTLRYYERVGMIPPVTRTEGGIRNYTEEDLRWVELAKCMRSAGLPVEAMIEYVRLYKEGDSTIPARLQLLIDQRQVLLEQRKQIDETLNRLNYKISRYEKAVQTGVLSWESSNE